MCFRQIAYLSFIYFASSLSGSASEFAEKVLDHRHLGPQTFDSSVSPKLLNEKIRSSICRTNFFSASEVRFCPELGDQIDFQMAPAVILSQINPDRDKILQSSGNNFYEESQIFSSRIISAPIDSFNNSMKLEIHQGTESHIFPNHLQAGAIWRTDEIAYRDEFQSLSYSANMSGVDADALLNTQLTVLGFP